MKGRFAPSPSGRMHLGNVYTALVSWLSARQRGGRWLLRIEDLDGQRCRRDYAAQIMDDLRWLGLEWDEGPSAADGPRYFQSARTPEYRAALAALERQGLVYDCFCSRADVRASSAPHAADAAPVYSGRCRLLSAAEREALRRVRPPARRVAVGARGSAPSAFADGLYGVQSCDLAADCGDFIVRRGDGVFAYQLAVVVDDALMGVTEVVRGRDLLPATHQQLFLYRALGSPPPQFFHLPLLCAAGGRRLSKRDGDTGMGALRERFSPEGLAGHILWLCGMQEEDAPLSLDEALSLFSWERMPRGDIAVE